MGMSASQARYLNLLARQSNLEYQGQQINQERSILSQQCTALYNSLLALDVPTPPSTNDYTKVEYSGADGATKFTLGTVKPSGENYLVELQQESTGAAITGNYGSSVVTRSGAQILAKPIQVANEVATGNYSLQLEGTQYQAGDLYFEETALSGADLQASGANPADYIKADASGYAKVTTFDPSATYYKLASKATYDAAADKTKFSHIRPEVENQSISVKAEDLSKYYIVVNGTTSQLSANSPYVKDNGDGTFSFKTVDGAQFYEETAAGGTPLTNPNACDLMIAGKKAYTFAEASKSDDFKSLDWEKYREAIKNTYGSQDNSLTEDDFYVFFTTTDTGVLNVQFALKTDVESPDGFAETFSYTANGKYTKAEEVDQCKLEFDEQGRITKISIPTYDETTGQVISYRDVALKAETVTDELAYQDAYAQYEYKQYEYDKLQQEINAKTEIIQQEDRNLELKLQRLDNERTQITTELEAVEKVINDNIESSYKTFSG